MPLETPTSAVLPVRIPSRPDLAASLGAALLVLVAAWLWERANPPEIPVAFVHYAVGTVTEETPLRSRPAGGEVLRSVAPGDRVSIGGRLRMHAGLMRADAYWVSVADDGGVIYGYLPAPTVVRIAGEAPVLDLDGLPVAQVEPDLADPSASEPGPAMTGAGGGGILIPWLPPSVDRWEPLLVSSGQAYGVDPDLLAIITLVESGGNPNVVSRSGAVGLMQLMPATAAEIAQNRGLTEFSVERLTEPGLNIDFGAYYLSRMLRRFGQAEDPDWRTSVDRAAAAYNGGPGSAERWLAGGDLPAETERYREYVNGMWEQRHDADSAAYRGWLSAGGARLVQGASEAIGGQSSH